MSETNFKWTKFDSLFVIGSALWVILFLTLIPFDALFFRSDTPYFYATEFAVRTSLQHGELPLWNIYYSEPLLANPQAMALYPLTAFLRVFSIRTSMIIQMGFHMWLAPVAAYLLLRDLQFSQLASTGGAVSIGFSTMIIARVVQAHYSVVPIFGWIYLTTFFYRRYLHKSRLIDFFMAILTTSLVILSGHTQFSVLGMLIPGSYFVYYVMMVNDRSSVIKALLQTLAIGVLTMGLLAIQLLPTLEYLFATSRTDGFSYVDATAYSVDPIRLLNIIIPFGPSEVYGLESGFQTTTLYSTTMTLGLVWISFYHAVAAYRRLARYLVIISLIVLVMAMGSYLPFYRIIYEIIPAFRVPSRLIIVWGFCACLLTAIGIETLSKKGDTRFNKPLWFNIALGVLLLFLLLFATIFLRRYFSVEIPFYIESFLISGIILVLWATLLIVKPWFGNKHWMWLFVFMIFLDATLNAVYIPLWPLYRDRYPPQAANFEAGSPYQCLANNIDPAKIRVLQSNLGEQEVVRTAASFGIPVIQIYAANIIYVNDLVQGDENIQRLLSASYNIGTEPPATAGREVIAQECDLILYRHVDPVPRIYAAADIIVVDNARLSSLNKVSETSFDPLRTSIVSVPEDMVFTGSSSDMPLDYEAELIAYEPDSLLARVDLSEPAMVVIAEPYYPGWQATIDGEATDIWRVNHALRGVWVEEGQHQIEMVYDPESFHIGARISLGTLSALLIGIVISTAVYFRKTHSNSG